MPKKARLDLAKAERLLIAAVFLLEDYAEVAEEHTQRLHPKPRVLATQIREFLGIPQPEE